MTFRGSSGDFNVLGEVTVNTWSMWGVNSSIVREKMTFFCLENRCFTFFVFFLAKQEIVS